MMDDNRAARYIATLTLTYPRESTLTVSRNKKIFPLSVFQRIPPYDLFDTQKNLIPRNQFLKFSYRDARQISPAEYEK